MKTGIVKKFQALLIKGTLGLFFGGLFMGVGFSGLAVLDSSKSHGEDWVCLIISILLIIYGIVSLNRHVRVIHDRG